MLAHTCLGADTLQERSANRRIGVKTRVGFIAAAALMIGGSAGCSSGEVSAKQEPGTVPPGTAQVTIAGKELSTTRAVQCAPAEKSLTTITTGNDASGATVMVSNAGKLTVEFVRIRNLSGFTGDYNRGLGGDATVALTDNTYQIAGAAFGYGPKSPEPTTEPFTIKVSC
jgi:lipoprotein LpqH